jgi:predicted Abi (CAAX) family protease
MNLSMLRLLQGSHIVKGTAGARQGCSTQRALQITKWFYYKCPEIGHDVVSHPINPQGIGTTSQPLAIFRHRVRAAEGPAMTEPPWWLTIDVTVIVTSAILIGIAFWIGVL